MKSAALLLLFSITTSLLLSQINETPARYYQWKGNKTEPSSGFVILKSGKKLEGQISLKGSPTNITDIIFVGDGKEIAFPPAALQSYGLTGITAEAATAASGPINDSPENMYNWQFFGVVMNKEIFVTESRNGYVILTDGSKHEGELKLKKKGGVLEDFEVKTAAGKIKYEVAQVAHYGYNLSDAEFQQITLTKSAGELYSGKILTSSGMQTGEIGLFGFRPGGLSYSKFIFKNNNGNLTEYTPSTVGTFFISTNKGEEFKYIAYNGVYVEEGFDGNVFRLYRNPNPTTVNEFATSMAKSATQATATVVATAAVKADQKQNNYDSNMDSVIRVSSTADLIKLRDGLVSLAGYSSVSETLEKSDNESLKTNLSALDLAISGREMSSTMESVMNEEWIISNKKTGEKTIIYKNEYKNLIEPLLKGCYEYLSMDKAQQNDYSKWDNLQITMKLLDQCY